MMTVENMAAMFNGFELSADPLLTGVGKAVKDGNRFVVSPALFSLIKDAKTQNELKKILASVKVVDIGPKEHDAQWHLDDIQITLAKLNVLMGR